MALNLIAKKSSYVGRLRNSSTNVLDALSQAIATRQGLIDAGFASGANVLTDADVQAVYPDITAADVLAASNALQAISDSLAANNRAGFIALEKMRNANS